MFNKMVCEHLHGEVNSRSGRLSPKERNFIGVGFTISAMMIMDYKAVLRAKTGMVSMLRAAVKRTSQEEILEVFLQIAHECGWSAALNALLVAKEVFNWEQLKKGISASAEPEISDSEKFKMGQRILQQLEGGKVTSDFTEELFPDFWKITVGHVFGNIWSRPGLSLRDRIIISLTANIALKFNYGLERSMRWALNNDISREAVLEVIMHVAHFRGWPAGINAIRVAKEVFSSKESPQKAVGSP
jgi:4-carboxymuconolactone decarboxylase